MTISRKELIDSVNDDNGLVELLAELLKIPSDNPPGDTTAIAAFISDYLKSYGVDVEVIVTKPGIANIVATIGEGDTHLVLNGHLDTFPAEVGEEWTIPPYSGLVKEGRIYGRGAGDMKGGLAALLYCFAKISQTSFNGRLTFTGTSDEEIDGEDRGEVPRIHHP